MTRINHTGRFRIVAAASMVAALAATGCSLGDQSAPSLTGPSEFGLSVTMTASPDQLPRDGSSQSVISVIARDAQGRPVANQRMTIGLSSGAAAASASEVITDASGRATFSITAPTMGSVVSGNQLVIFLTPIGGNFDNAAARSLSIALIGPSNTTLPNASFTVSPAVPEVNQLASFDATPTTDEGAQCLDACTYTWNFDDGGTATGRVVTHRFTTARPYNVALTVTDASGVEVSLRQLVNVSSPAAPTVLLTVAPNPPILNQQATFTATATPAANHSIVQYEWNFGDGTTSSTSVRTVTKTYSALGTIAVTVRAIDDLGQMGAASLTLTIGSGINATFTISPTNPRANTAVNFNAASSTPSNGATISQYDWDWGDGSTSSSSSPTIQHTYTVDRIFVVRLTITDSQGRVGTITQNVTVAP